MHIAVLTSGGDAPGMNAAIRTIAVAGISRGHRVSGIRRGYQGLLDGDVGDLALAAIVGITQQGGTVLGSSRSAMFVTPEGQALARQRLRELAVDALIVIGGNGSLTGAHALATHALREAPLATQALREAPLATQALREAPLATQALRGAPLATDRPCLIVGLPASIDNDIGHSGLSIGVDSAVNTIVEACDRISDTARAHRRAFIVEVMGRKCGFLAMRAGLAAEADAILYGESGLGEEELVTRLREVLRRSFGPSGYKQRALIVKSEGVCVSAAHLAKRLSEYLVDDLPGVDIRETVLGHVVRGGNPSALDRVIGQRLGFSAVLACERGAHDVMMAWEVPGGFGIETGDPSVRAVPIADVLSETDRLLDGTSPIVMKRMEMLAQVEHLLIA